MSEKQKRSELVKRERLENLAKAIASPEGRNAIADILATLGLGRVISEFDLPAYNRAIGIFWELRQADAAAACEILKIIYGVNDL